MIRYYVIVAVLSIYSHSTNAAASFNGNMKEIEDHLRDEKKSLMASFQETTGKLDNNIGEVSPSRERILCDVLNNTEKQSICDEIMLFLVHKEREDVFLSFEDTGFRVPLPVPELVSDLDNLYTCEGMRLENLNMAKPMFWCRSKHFRTKLWEEYGELYMRSYGIMRGFFCAGSRTTPGRVFVFRPATLSSRVVSPVGELNDADVILKYEPRDGDSSQDSSSTSSPSVASSCEDKMTQLPTDKIVGELLSPH